MLLLAYHLALLGLTLLGAPHLTHCNFSVMMALLLMAFGIV